MFDKTLHQSRAMKELLKSNLTPRASRKILKEVELLKSLDHPYIMKIYEVVESKSSYYVISELLQGGELFDQIVKYKQLSENKAATYLKYLMTALSYLHSKKIVHRDLKPENLVFVEDSPDSALKLIDFGISMTLKYN